MSDADSVAGSEQQQGYSDSAVDSLASVVIMTIVIAGVLFWLTGF